MPVRHIFFVALFAAGFAGTGMGYLSLFYFSEKQTALLRTDPFPHRLLVDCAS